jgi:nucleoside-diphosphate-sugar epimerase
VSGGPAGLAGARVLVTGASGFIGRALCRRLLDLDAQVWGAARRSAAPFEGFDGFSTGDLASPGAARALFEVARPEVVFHLASQVSGSREPAAVLPTFQGNLASTVSLLVAAQEAGCRRLVLAGSMEEPEPGEEAPPVPASPYAAAKGAASAYSRMFHALYGTPVVTARLFMVYGPGQRDLAKLVPYVILSLLRGERPRLGPGRRPIDWIYVDDVVRGLVALATAPGIEGERLDLGSGALVAVREVVERLADQMRPEAELGFGDRPERPLEVVRRADVTATRRRIGWSPEVSLGEGLRRTVEWYREALATGTIRG